MQAEADEAGRTLDLTPLQSLLSDLIVHDDVVGHIDLRADGYRLALVTNNVREGAAAWRAMIPVDDLFDVVVDSSSVGMRKPNPAIFTTPSTCWAAWRRAAVFLDDVEGNLAGARLAGPTPSWWATRPGRPSSRSTACWAAVTGPRPRRAEPRRDGPHRETLGGRGLTRRGAGLQHIMSEAAVPLPLPEEAGYEASARWRADVALVVAAFFGTTFVVVQDAVETADPLPFIAVRFLIAGAVLWLVGRRRAPTPLERRHGVAAGSALLAGYVLQTVGLQYTSPSTSAFITYLLVVFVPLSLAVLRRRPHPDPGRPGDRGRRPGAAHGGAGTSFGRGELLTLRGRLRRPPRHRGETAARHDAIRFTCVQVTTVGWPAWPPASCPAGSPCPPAVGAAFTGVLATALRVFAMVWAQRVVSPRAALHPCCSSRSSPPCSPG